MTQQQREVGGVAFSGVGEHQGEPRPLLYPGDRPTVQQMQAFCHDTAATSGWWLDTETGEDVRTWPKKHFDLWVASKLMLVVTEVAEAMEGHRKGLLDDKLPHRSMLEVEMADAVIRIFDLAGGLGMDMQNTMLEKVTFNRTRADHKVENRLKAGGKSI